MKKVIRSLVLLALVSVICSNSYAQSGPDLVVSFDPTVVNLTVHPLSWFSAPCTVKNQGTMAAGVFKVCFYKLSSPAITPSDQPFEEEWISTPGFWTPGASFSFGTWLDMDPTTAGNYYLGVWADCENSVAETNESNNFAYTPISVVDPPCTYASSPTSQSFDSEGGTGSVSVTAPSYCSWDVYWNCNPFQWLTLTSSWKGTGNGTVYYSVSPNTDPGSRTCDLKISPSYSVALSVTQAGSSSCTYTLSVNTNPPSGGTVTINPQKSTYCAGDVVTLTATPNLGWIFSSWSGVDSSNGSTATVTMNGNRSVTANFTTTPTCTYTLSVNTNPSSGGTVAINPQKGTYCAGDQVTLTAISNSGYTFWYWSGGAGGSGNPTTITMNGNRSVTANFTPTCTYLILPTSRNHGSGAETGSVSVTAGSGCSWTATSNASWITITSGTSGSGNGTVNYSVSANPGPNSRTGTMTIAGQTFTVTQAAPTCTYTLSVSINRPSGGTVSKNPDKSTYCAGDQVTLTATINSGYTFSSWSGVDSSNATTATVTMNSNRTVTATFTQNQYTLTVNTVGSGSVSKSPDKANYNSGDTVQLTATANPGWSFSSWSGDASGSTNPVTVTMNGNKTVTATFTTTCTYTLSVSINRPSGGTVSKSPDKSTYCAGDQVTLTANVNPGYTFSSWSGVDWSNGTTATVTMNSNRTVTVNFNINSSACTNSISPPSVGHGPGFEPGSVNVTADSGCSWTATSNASWITITSGTSGSGNGTVNYSVSENTSSNARTGALTIAGLTFNVMQIGVRTEGFSNISQPPVSNVSQDWKLYGIHFPSFDTGWAVGHEAANSRGVLLKFTAPCQEGCEGNWETVTPPSVSSNWYLVGVHFTSPGEGWAVGQDSGGSSGAYLNDPATATTARGSLLHYLNGSWTSVAPPSVSSSWSIEGVHFASPSEGWAVGSDSANKKGVLLHYSQGSWTPVAPPDVSPQWELYGIYLLSSNEGWAVGSDMSNNCGVLLHYLNGSWTSPPPPSVSSSWYLEGVHFTSSNEGWAVGPDNAGNRGVLLHYLNGFWTSVTPPDVSPDWDLYSVHFVSSSQGWASGNDIAHNKGLFLRYSAGTWNSVTLPNVNSSWSTTGVRCRCSESWSVGNDLTNKWGLTIQHTDATSGEKPNLVPYRPKGWSDKIVVSSVKGTNTDSSNLYNTQNLYASFAVVNDSQTPVRSTYYVDLYVDGVLNGSWEWNPLNGCHYRYLKDYPIGSLSVGAHSIKIKVDSTGLIDESNKGDNEYEKTITVVSSDKPNVVFSQQMGWSDKVIVSKKKGTEISYPLTTKDTLYVSWRVENKGGAKTPGKVTVSLYVDGVQKKSWQKNSMAPSSKWVKTNQSIGKLSVGEHEIKLVAGAGNLTPANEGDNEVVKKINVQGTAGQMDPPTFEGSTYLGMGETSEYLLHGSVCSKGGDVEYYLDWGDGSPPENWFPAGQSKTHSWNEGYYEVSGKARCKDYPDIESESVSFALTVGNGMDAYGFGGGGDD
jgi:hypothetical protein